LEHADEWIVLLFRVHRRFLTTGALLLLAFATVPTLAVGQNAPAPEKPAAEKQDAAVRAQMRNVNYHFADNVAVHIKSLTGALVPVGDHEFPVLDDKNSFRIRVDTAEIAINPADLGNLLNSYVFARPHSPLAGISIVIANGQLKIKGKVRDKGDIPFETLGMLSPTPDGKVRLHSEKIKALHVPVKGLMDAFGVEIGDLIKTGKLPGVQAEEDDLILDLSQILPPPHIQGKVTAIRIEGNAIVQIFGTPDNKPAEKLANANYVSCQGNRLRVGNLTMTDTDIILTDLDPSDPLDFYLDHYKEQLAAGYAKIAANFQVRVFVKDFDKLGKAKPPAAKKNSASPGTP
jgi:hypothetical protein